MKNHNITSVPPQSSRKSGVISPRPDGKWNWILPVTHGSIHRKFINGTAPTIAAAREALATAQADLFKDVPHD